MELVLIAEQPLTDKDLFNTPSHSRRTKIIICWR
jgi:hypothetical protein